MLAFLAILLSIPITIYRGWVLSLLWGWFVVPLGVPEIGVVLAIGLATTIGMVSAPYIPQKVADLDEYGFGIGVYSIVTSTIALLLGFVVSLFL